MKKQKKQKNPLYYSPNLIMSGVAMVRHPVHRMLGEVLAGPPLHRPLAADGREWAVPRWREGGGLQEGHVGAGLLAPRQAGHDQFLLREGEGESRQGGELIHFTPYGSIIVVGGGGEWAQLFSSFL
jgi:hypothetical protein